MLTIAPSCRNLLLFSLCLLALAGCRTPATQREGDLASLRHPPAGSLLGRVGEYSAHVWRGIPYAEPPVGARRWRAPRPLSRWEGVRNAFDAGAPCTQVASPYGGPRGANEGEPVGSEDCLFLDVYAPRWEVSELPTDEARVPVLLWIHGGSNVIGTASFYDGGNLAATHGVIVVAINYRLGPMGWLRHEVLREGRDALDASGNFGTLDMIRALEWVAQNVGAFGGDPDNVTIFGESAGGLDVYSLLLSPLARGLFHRAIVQSGGLWTHTPAEAEHFVDDPVPGAAGSSSEALLRFLLADGIAEDRDEAKRRLAAMPQAEVARLMHSRTAEEWLSVYEEDGMEGLSDMPTVFTDGAVLPPEPPLEVFLKGEHSRVPLLAGTNRDENKLYLMSDPALVRRWFGVIPQVRDARLYQAGAEHLSAMWKATGADVPASAIALSQEEPVFVYRWDWDEEPTILGSELSTIIGAAHGLEVPFVFGHFDLGPVGNVVFSRENEGGRHELAHAMMSYWAEFAYAGRPGTGRAGDLVEWRPWQPSREPEFMLLDTSTSGGIRHQRGLLTEGVVLQRVEADERLTTGRERCAVMRSLAGWGSLADGEYPALARAQCAAFPFEDYPWE